MPTINYERVDYQQMSKAKKLACFLVMVGPETAAQILKSFEDAEVEQICQEIVKIDIMDQELMDLVADEFSDIVGGSLVASIGGSSFAQRALTISQGEFKAGSIMGRIQPQGSTAKLIEEITEMEPRQIVKLMEGEQAQTIAFLISHLPTPKVAAVVSMLAPAMREDVVELIGSMGSTGQEMVSKVVDQLKEHMDKESRQTLHKSGGIMPLANLLNYLDKDVSKTLLTKLEERNPTLGMAVRRKMFAFEDLVRMDIADLQRIAREVEMQDLVLAMKGANPALQEALMKSVSKRAAETLKDELDLLGPVRVKEVESAQDRIIQIVRSLEEEGEISLDNDADNAVI